MNQASFFEGNEPLKIKKPVNKGFFQNWSLHYAEQQINFGLVFEAIKQEDGGI